MENEQTENIMYGSEDEVYLNIGLHDHYDQEICKWAKILEIDTIVFQHEIRETRSVSEILDTRNFSYDHLVRIEGEKEEKWYDISEKYPTIWFIDNGFVRLTNFKIDRKYLNKVVVD